MYFFLAALLAFGLTSIPSIFEASAVPPSCAVASQCDCSDSTPGEFSVCATDSVGGSPGGSGTGVQMRECKYFANGTIDLPTMTIITAWVPVGSRLCIGDAVPQPSSASAGWPKQAAMELRDKFTALATRPSAWWSPGGAVENQDPIQLGVSAQAEIISGSLLGRPAEIRFRPVSARWEISDGDALYGFLSGHSFDAAGTYFATAFVEYEVDYRLTGSSWVLQAATWELRANKLTIAVIERERRTLLVG